MREMGRYLFDFIRLYPAFLIVGGLLNGIFSFVLSPDLGYISPLFTTIFLLFMIYCLISLPDFFPSDKKRKKELGTLGRAGGQNDLNYRSIALAKFAFFTLIGWGIACSSSTPSRDHYVRKLPKENCAAEIKVRFSDKTDPGDDVKWLSHPAQVEAEIFALRLTTSANWSRCSGKVMLKFPDRKGGKYSYSNRIKPLDYGHEAILQGAFIDPEREVFSGAFNYKQYLRIKGIYKLYYVTSLKTIEADTPFYTSIIQKILHFRNKIMCQMSKGMDIKNRKMLAALMFGCRYGLDFKSRRTYLHSGVIHIFAISGLHVGMIAVTLYLLFCWTPFRFRYILVPSLLALYVMTTGMHTSALRALLMISVWSLMKAFLYRTAPLNIVFLAASIILIINPFELFAAGFQFSFTIAFFLVLAWESVKEWLALIQERSLWIPSENLLFKDHLAVKIKLGGLNSFITSCVAWLSGSFILLAHRSFLIPGALFTNFFIIPFVWILFALALLDLLCMPFYKLFTLNPLIEIFLNAIRGISSLGAELGGGGNITTPSWYIVVIFFTALIFLVTAGRRWVFFLAGSIVFILFMGLFNAPKWKDETFSLFYGGESQEPGIVLIPPDSASGVTVLNPGALPRAKAILSFLQKNGVNSVDYLIFSENRKSCCEAAWLIIAGIEVKKVIFPSGFTRSRYAEFAMKKALISGASVKIARSEKNQKQASLYRDPGIIFSRKSNSDYNLNIIRPEYNVSISRKEVMSGEKKIIKLSSKSQKIYDLLNSNHLRFID
jgi:ComEC/Rec2-related protein